MNEIPAALALLGLAVIAFVGSIRVGMLLGRGIDRYVESHHAEDRTEESAAADPVDTDRDSSSGGTTLE